MDLFMSVKAVADVLGVSAKTVYKMCDSGELVSVKIGRCRRVSTASLNGYIAERLRSARAQRTEPKKEEKPTRSRGRQARKRGERQGYRYVQT